MTPSRATPYPRRPVATGTEGAATRVRRVVPADREAASSVRTRDAGDRHAAKWTVPAPGRRPPGGLRLLFFPFAGGGASAFADWQSFFPETVETYAIQFPGRETRWGEPPFDTMTALVTAIADELMPAVPPPFALVGHSMGGQLAYELTRVLRARGQRLPVHLFVAGACPAHLRRETDLHQLGDAEFVEKLRTFGGLPPELLKNEEFLALLLPVIRNDFRLYEQHVSPPGEPLQVPITVFGGANDEKAPVETFASWQALTVVPLNIETFPGGHFFFFDHGAAIAERILAGIRRTLAPPSPKRD